MKGYSILHMWLWHHFNDSIRHSAFHGNWNKEHPCGPLISKRYYISGTSCGSVEREALLSVEDEHRV